MKVALLGATGFVGSALLKEALDRGHTVTAIVRDPEKLEKRDGLIPKGGDVYDTASLAGLIESNDALISAFNPGWKDPNLYDDQVRGTKAIIAAAKKAGIKRVVWVGGGGAPKGYDAAAYGRDIGVFVPFMKKDSPETTILGPGGVGEGLPLVPIGLAGGQLTSEDLLKATGPVFDAFSYHSYGATSQRCASMGLASQTTAEAALSDDQLSRADRIEEFYASLRDKYEPGKPMWLTETADAACGGNPWASTFLDSFRYLDHRSELASVLPSIERRVEAVRATSLIRRRHTFGE